jgi:hypothetical protein
MKIDEFQKTEFIKCLVFCVSLVASVCLSYYVLLVLKPDTRLLRYHPW